MEAAPPVEEAAVPLEVPVEVPLEPVEVPELLVVPSVPFDGEPGARFLVALAARLLKFSRERVEFAAVLQLVNIRLSK